MSARVVSDSRQCRCRRYDRSATAQIERAESARKRGEGAEGSSEDTGCTSMDEEREGACDDGRGRRARREGKESTAVR